jgi:hypothetical protein
MLDRGTNTLKDGYSDQERIKVAAFYLQPKLGDEELENSMAYKEAIKECLRDRFDFLMGDAMIRRGDEKRKATMSDLQSIEIRNETIGPTPALALILNMRRSKRNQVIRHYPFFPFLKSCLYHAITI